MKTEDTQGLVYELEEVIINIRKVWNKRLDGERLFGDWELALLIGVAIPLLGVIITMVLAPQSEFVAVFSVWLCASLFWLVVDILIIFGCVLSRRLTGGGKG